MRWCAIAPIECTCNEKDRGNARGDSCRNTAKRLSKQKEVHKKGKT